MSQVFTVNDNNNTNTDMFYDLSKKFNAIKPKITNDFFELDIFFSRIVTGRYLSSISEPPLHKHSFYELIIPLQGTSTYTFKKYNSCIFQNKIYLIVPNAKHRLVSYSEDFASLTFGFYFISPASLSLPIANNKPFLELELSTYLKNSILYMLALSSGTEKGFYQRLNMQFSLILFDIFNQVSAFQKALPDVLNNDDIETISDNTRIRTAIQYITDNIASDISVSDVSSSVSISTRQLNRILASSMNISINELINKIKIKEAKKYMNTSHLSLTQISTMCGFNSLTSFNRTFKANTGLTPKAYRANKNITVDADEI